MNNNKYKKVFTDSFSLDKKNIESLEYNSIPKWD